MWTSHFLKITKFTFIDDLEINTLAVKGNRTLLLESGLFQETQCFHYDSHPQNMVKSRFWTCRGETYSSQISFQNSFQVIDMEYVYQGLFNFEHQEFMTSGCRKEQKDSCAVGVETNPFFRKSSKAENSRNVFKDGNRNFIFPLSLHISKQVKIFLKNIRFLREHWKYCEQQVILIYIFPYFHARKFFISKVWNFTKLAPSVLLVLLRRF